MSRQPGDPLGCFCKGAIVQLKQRDGDPSELFAGTLTDEERSDDQQSRELHCGLLRGRSAGAGGVRSVVIHVTMHEVYTWRFT
jgi:hypothetical protein